MLSDLCHWWELLQVSFLLWQKFCHDKTHLLLRQKYACCSKTFVATKYFCCDKHVCRDKTFVVTKDVLPQQTCHKSKLETKTFLATNILSQWKLCFVRANPCLSRQKWYLWQLPPMIDLKPHCLQLTATSLHNAVAVDTLTYALETISADCWILFGLLCVHVFISVEHVSSVS